MNRLVNMIQLVFYEHQIILIFIVFVFVAWKMADTKSYL